MEDTIDYSAVFGIDAAQTSNGAQVLTDSASAEHGPAIPAHEGKILSDAALSAASAEPAAQTSNGAQVLTDSASAEHGPAIPAHEGKILSDAALSAASAERDAAIQKAREEAQAEAQRIIDEAFKQSGMMNPYTEQPITTKEEYDAYRQRYDAEKKKALLRKSGMTDAEFDAFVQNLPEVRRAKQAQEQAEKAQREAHFAAARVKVDEQLKEISALDPSIKELSDLAKMPAYPRFYELVKKGNSLTDAFKLANYDALTKGAMQGARQSALNAAQGKMHMEQTRSRGTPVSAVPPDVRDMYRALNPDATDSEIQAHYQRYHKN